MTPFVLIVSICLSGSGCGVSTYQFKTLAACKTALVEVQQAHPAPYKVEGSCSSVF